MTAVFPPVGRWLVERCDRVESHTVRLAQVLDDFGEISGEILLAGTLQIGCAVMAAGDAAADGHPIRRRIGKGLHAVHAAGQRRLEHPALALVGIPIPVAARRLKARHPGAKLKRVRAVRIFPAADVVADDIEFERVENHVRTGVTVGIAAYDVCPPTKRHAPALKFVHENISRINSRGIGPRLARVKTCRRLEVCNRSVSRINIGELLRCEGKCGQRKTKDGKKSR